jgi:hypothetical protein
VRKGLTPTDLGDLLDLPRVAVLATYRRDGTVLLSPVWHEWRDDGFNVVTGSGDVKAGPSGVIRARASSYARTGRRIAASSFARRRASARRPTGRSSCGSRRATSARKAARSTRRRAATTSSSASSRGSSAPGTSWTTSQSEDDRVGGLRNGHGRSDRRPPRAAVRRRFDPGRADRPLGRASEPIRRDDALLSTGLLASAKPSALSQTRWTPRAPSKKPWPLLVTTQRTPSRSDVQRNGPSEIERP